MSRPTSIGVGTGEPVHSLENRMNSDIINILTRPLEHEWSVQGLGFMRTYLPADGAYTNETQRLHIWHKSLAILGATPLHNHPWGFYSEVMFGMVKQHRAVVVDADSSLNAMRYRRQRILCGEGGGITGDPESVRLASRPMETYGVGATYHQDAEEIHYSYPDNNTVTVITREFQEDRGHADVFIPQGADFISAHPRPATRAEILYITREVLHAYQEFNP